MLLLGRDVVLVGARGMSASPWRCSLSPRECTHRDASDAGGENGGIDTWLDSISMAGPSCISSAVEREVGELDAHLRHLRRAGCAQRCDARGA